MNAPKTTAPMTFTLGLLVVFATAPLAACGTEAADEPAEPEIVAPTPEPEPEPEPIPEPVADCPTDTWSVAADGPNQATETGVDGAGWVRSMSNSWARLRVCRTYGDDVVNLSCAPVQGGAECELRLAGGRRCTSTLPRPVLPVVVGQLIDTHEQPAEGTWRCSGR